MTPVNRYYTNSELQTMRRCARKWYLSQYRRLYRRAEKLNQNRTIGELVHYGLAEMYNHGQDPIAAVVFEAARMRAEQQTKMSADMPEGSQMASIIEENIATLAKAEAFAKIMVEGYVEWLEETGADSHLELIAAESEVSAQLAGTGFPKDGTERPMLLGKLDARFNNHMVGSRQFLDHKTVQNFGDREPTAHLDTQFRFYSLIEYLSKPADDDTFTDGGIMNMLRRVKRTGTAKPPFYKRLEIRHSMIELQNFYKRTVGEVSRIQTIELQLDQGVDHQMVCPPSPTKDCSWDCQFMSLCAFMDDGSDSEEYIGATFEIGDPLRRYDTVEG